MTGFAVWVPHSQGIKGVNGHPMYVCACDPGSEERPQRVRRDAACGATGSDDPAKVMHCGWDKGHVASTRARWIQSRPPISHRYT